jgi:hypothetical protein
MFCVAATARGTARTKMEQRPKKEETVEDQFERDIYKARTFWGAEENYGTQDQPFETYDYQEVSRQWKVLETIGTAIVTTSDRSASAMTATAVIWAAARRTAHTDDNTAVNSALSKGNNGFKILSPAPGKVSANSLLSTYGILLWPSDSSRWLQLGQLPHTASIRS